MSYMYQLPRYQEVLLSRDVAVQYPQYSLHYYYESQRPLGALTLPLQGVPALFLPGNAGSHKQARSSASIALRMHSSDFPRKRHFDFFTISFNEELSGMFGGVLSAQTNYVAACIQHILSLYEGVKPRPQSLVIIGHSMGGVLAHGVFSLAGFNHSSISTIIALSSPLTRPVLTFDPLIQQYYGRIKEVWSEPSEAMSSVTLVSISGGERDIMVPAHLSIHLMSLNLATPAIPRNWASADHLAVVWCRRVQLALTRGLFLLQDERGRGLTRNSTHRYNTFHHLLLQGKELPFDLHDNSTLQQRKRKGVLLVNDTEFYQVGLRKNYKSIAVSLPVGKKVLAASDTQQVSWLHVCSAASTLTCRDLSSYCSLLPPKSRVVKVALLSTQELRAFLPGATHLLVASPATHRFVRVQTCSPSPPTTLPLPWLRMSLQLPTGHCSLVNLSLPHLNKVWQSYSVSVSSSCGGVAGGLVLPWYPHHPLSNSTHSPLIVRLSLLAPPPLHLTTHPHLLLWSPPECPLEIQVTSDPWGLLDKLAIIHVPLLLPWLSALCLAASVPSFCLKFELLLLVLVMRSILRAFSSSALLDWEELDALWGGWGPAVIHLVACGLHQLLDGCVIVATHIIQACLGRWRRGLSWLLLATSVFPLPFCSSLSLAFANSAVLLQAGVQGPLKEVVCLLVCLQVLTLPSLFSWVRAISFSLQLFPDPHVVSVGAAILLVGACLYSAPSTHGNRERSWRSPVVTVIKAVLAVFVLGSCLLRVYRMTTPILIHLLLVSLVGAATKNDHTHLL